MLRPGRVSFYAGSSRAPLCDRLVITMFNRVELSADDFNRQSSSVYLNDKGRRTVLNA